MPKINTNTGGSRRHSTGSPREASGAYAQEPAKDPRGKTNNRGEQGMGVCPSCGVTNAMRKVSYGNPSRLGDLPVGAIVLGSHRAGGGAFSARRGDVLCPGAGCYPVKDKTGEQA